MVTKKEVSRWLDLHPQYKKRSTMYLATLAFTHDKLGTGPLDPWHPGHVEVAIHAHRRMQEILPNDEKGETLEKAYRKDNGMQSGLEVVEEIRKEFVIGGQVMRVKA